MEAAILAGGFGTSLKPLTSKIPKPLMPINGIPLIERIIHACELAELERVLVVIRHNKEISNYFEKKRPEIEITYIEKDTKSTLDAFFTLKDYLYTDRNFCLLYSDLVFQPSEFCKFINHAKKSNNDLIACVTEGKPTYTFRVVFDEKYKIYGIYDDVTKSSFVLGGIYSCSPKLFNEEEEANCMGLRTITDFLRKIVLKKGYDIVAYKFRRIYNVNTVNDLEEAEKFLQAFEKF